MGKISDEMTAGGHSPEKIQQEIRHTEAEMSETLTEIQERLAPEHLKQEFLGRVKSSVNEAMGQVRRTVRQNPVPVALLGAGVLFLGARRLMRSSSGRTQKRREEASISPGPVMGEEALDTREARWPSEGIRGFSKEDYMVAGAIGLLAGAALAFLPKRSPVEERPYTFGEYGVTKGEVIEEGGPIIK